MQALLIVLAVILLLLILLSLPVTLDVRLEDSCRLTLRWLFLRFSLYPRPEKERKKAGPEKKEKSKKPAEKKPAVSNPLRQIAEEQGFPAAVEEACRLIQLLASRFRRLLTHVRADPFRLEISVGGEDAAETAIAYGGVCAAVYPALGVLWQLIRFGRFTADISPDFSGGKSRVRLRAAFRLSPLTALCFLVGFILDVIKWKAGQPAPATVKEGVQK